MDIEINVNVKFKVFTKASNDCDPIVDDPPSGVLRVVPFEDPLQQASAVMYSMRSREYDVAGAASTSPSVSAYTDRAYLTTRGELS